MNVRHDRALENEILEAFVLLFDPKCSVSIRTVKSIKPLEIKLAYRRKALQTHPDRARFIGKNERVLAALFTQVTSAYEKLCEHSKDDWQVLKNLAPTKFTGEMHSYQKENAKKDEKGREKEPQQAHDPSSQPKTEPHGGTSCRFKWGIPNEELLLGQYLYYTGAVTWDELIRAIIWQRNQRPLFGEIAFSWKMLTRDDINRILKEKKRSDRIGEYAVRNGFISRLQQLAIVGKQKGMQVPIGQYFIDNGTMTLSELSVLVEQQRQHNFMARKQKKAV